MTTVLCLHASVAQKSYGQEKRFLCPPPLVRITGPYRRLARAQRPVLSMSILSEDGHRHLCQTAYMAEDDSNVHFKSLHISGAAKKAKFVLLQLSLHPPCSSVPQPVYHPGPELEQLSPAFATFRSTECNIISKPSKKTAKARNTQSCIFNGSTICLFNRINSQTVRTKYLCVQNGSLAARAAQWSAFVIKVVRRAEDQGTGGTPPLMTRTLHSSSVPGADRTVTYGSVVELIDLITGVSSGPLVVRKVEKNRVYKDAAGPVSQLQKLAFCQLSAVDSSSLYITAMDPSLNESTHSLDAHHPAGPGFPYGGNKHGLGSMGLSSLLPLAGGGLSDGVMPCWLHMLQLQPACTILPPHEPGGLSVDIIDDPVVWTIIGVAHFSHSFFDLSHHYPQIPSLPITPFPALTCRPIVDLQALTIHLSLSGFLHGHSQAMQVWLGPLGPLNATIMSTSLSRGANGGSSPVHEGLSNDGLRIVSDSSPAMQRGCGVRQVTTCLVNMPSLESIYSTLHRTSMPQNTVVVMGETNPTMNDAWTGDGEGSRKDSRPSSFSSPHTPALPITLIRPDGMSFVMGHSVCLSGAVEDVHNENRGDHASHSTEEQLKWVCVLKIV